jgi:hypothetical protein
MPSFRNQGGRPVSAGRRKIVLIIFALDISLFLLWGFYNCLIDILNKHFYAGHGRHVFLHVGRVSDDFCAWHLWIGETSQVRRGVDRDVTCRCGAGLAIHGAHRRQVFNMRMGFGALRWFCLHCHLRSRQAEAGNLGQRSWLTCKYRWQCCDNNYFTTCPIKICIWRGSDLKMKSIPATPTGTWIIDGKMVGGCDGNSGLFSK